VVRIRGVLAGTNPRRVWMSRRRRLASGNAVVVGDVESERAYIDRSA
jgi:hypothetical protein